MAEPSASGRRMGSTLFFSKFGCGWVTSLSACHRGRLVRHNKRLLRHRLPVHIWHLHRHDAVADAVTDPRGCDVNRNCQCQSCGGCAHRHPHGGNEPRTWSNAHRNRCSESRAAAVQYRVHECGAADGDVDSDGDDDAAGGGRDQNCGTDLRKQPVWHLRRRLAVSQWTVLQSVWMVSIELKCTMCAAVWQLSQTWEEPCGGVGRRIAGDRRENSRNVSRPTEDVPHFGQPTRSRDRSTARPLRILRIV